MGRWNGPEHTQIRPEKDSVALIDCGHPWCSREVRSASLEATMVAVLIDDGAREFCSAGCASRWLIRYELRSNPVTQPVTAPAVRVKTATRRQTEAAQMRAWARAQGIPVADHGFLSPGLIARYREAHP